MGHREICPARCLISMWLRTGLPGPCWIYHSICACSHVRR
ncbi:hypothetical protein HMPREF9056_00153 [Actinomyces sp. oral taxon 170 str. F0386]|nr:hypothetical protein HMPREF9056_00153 [Actinomyces sp. oral taxon 170 str. F0386]